MASPSRRWPGTAGPSASRGSCHRTVVRAHGTLPAAGDRSQRREAPARRFARKRLRYAGRLPGACHGPSRDKRERERADEGERDDEREAGMSALHTQSPNLVPGIDGNHDTSADAGQASMGVADRDAVPRHGAAGPRCRCRRCDGWLGPAAGPAQQASITRTLPTWKSACPGPVASFGTVRTEENSKSGARCFTRPGVSAFWPNANSERETTRRPPHRRRGIRLAERFGRRSVSSHHAL